MNAISPNVQNQAEFQRIQAEVKAAIGEDPRIQFDLIRDWLPRFDTSTCERVAWLGEGFQVEVLTSPSIPPTLDIPSVAQGNIHDQKALTLLKKAIPDADRYFIVIMNTKDSPVSHRGYFAVKEGTE